MYDALDNLAQEHSRFDIAPFVRVFKAMEGIKKACFCDDLDPEFESICDEFKASLIALDEMHSTSITTKYHMLCIHVKQYCQMTGKTLKLTSEQALESSHRVWTKVVERFWVNPNNPLFLFKILRAFETFLSENI